MKAAAPAARGLVVAIDGPSGAGKSTLGRALAARLGYTFIDTGAMYRALALQALASDEDLDDGAELARLLRASRLELRPPDRVLLDGRDVSRQIRARAVSRASSRVAAHPPVRREMVQRQRELGRDGSVVLDGRDIGTAVFPGADVKFYLDADPRERARRRRADLLAVGPAPALEVIEQEIRARDHADSTRSDSPLTRASDAVVVDTTGRTPGEVLDELLGVVQGRLVRPASATGAGG